jgi:hypothetical protein
MEKRSDKFDTGERVKVSGEKIEKKDAPQTVRLVLLRDLVLNYTGPVTKKLYVFSGAGAVVNVDTKDADIMLAKRSGDCCPGGSGPQPYFAKE